MTNNDNSAFNEKFSIMQKKTFYACNFGTYFLARNI